MQQSSPTCRVNELLRIVLLLFGGQMIARYLLHHFAISSSGLLGYLSLGTDFHLLYDAAKAWLAGQNPYLVSGFVTPPLSLVIPAALTMLPVERAAWVFLYCNVFLLSVALYRYLGALRLGVRERLLFMAVATLFVSTQESLLGGNLDGVMLALLLMAFSARRRVAGAVPLAASIAIKLYSIILLPVLVRRKQWRFVLLTLAAVTALLLPFFRLWPSALHALFSRGARYSHSSISPAALVYAMGGSVNGACKWVTLAFWLITFFWALYRDQERDLSPYTLARYVPWMLAWPMLVFSYVGILALAVPASLLATAQRRPLVRAEYVCFVGFLLLGSHPDMALDRMSLSYVSYTILGVAQSLGVVMMMVGTCLTPRGAGEREELDEAREEAARPCSLQLSR